MERGGEEMEIQEGFQSQGEQNKPLPCNCALTTPDPLGFHCGGPSEPTEPRTPVVGQTQPETEPLCSVLDFQPQPPPLPRVVEHTTPPSPLYHTYHPTATPH